VSVVEGKDAFVPLGEMPEKIVESAAGEDDLTSRPTLQVGQAVEFRVVRHSWQTDSFLASMLSYEESVARNRAARGQSSGPRSVPPAARHAPVEPSSRLESAAGSSRERPRAASPEISRPPPKHLVQKGFSFVNSAAASELNAWLKASTQDSRNRSSSSKAGPKVNEKKYIINVVRGMNAKVIGQLTFPTRASEKEVKDAAVDLAIQDGQMKAGQDHKGVTIAKNIITVKL